MRLGNHTTVFPSHLLLVVQLLLLGLLLLLLLLLGLLLILLLLLWLLLVTLCTTGHVASHLRSARRHESSSNRAQASNDPHPPLAARC